MNTDIEMFRRLLRYGERYAQDMAKLESVHIAFGDNARQAIEDINRLQMIIESFESGRYEIIRKAGREPVK